MSIMDVEYNIDERNCTRSIPHKLLLGGGPPNCSPRVLSALSQPPLSTLCVELFQLMDELREMLKYVFQTRNKVTFGMQSTGTGAIEAIFLNMLKPGEKVLVPVIGHLGKRVAEIAKRAQLQVIEITAPVGETFTLEELESQISNHKPALLFVVHGESSLGIVQPLEGIGDICQRHNCLLAVDAIASLGCIPFFTDKWKIDVALATSNKAMRGPSGLAFATFSPKAFERITSLKVPTLYFDLANIARVWDCHEQRIPYHYTFDAHFLFAAKVALSELIEEGLESAWNKHKMCCERLHYGMKMLGSKPFIQNSNTYLPMINLFWLPNGIDVNELISYASKKYSVQFAAGLGFGIYAEATKCIRIGLMGYNSRTELVDYALDVLKDAFEYFSNKEVK